MRVTQRSLLDRRQRTAKRLLDLTLAITGLLVLWPVLLLAAELVRRSSTGPVLYRHRRIGQHGREIEVLKFRTMYDSVGPPGMQVTVAGDPRITPIGQRLRDTKLDELPQLWNVVRGELSLVGPRPDVSGYLDRLGGRAALLMDERPGITGAASLCFREEEQLLARFDDPKRSYDEVVYPAKVRIDLEYFERWALGRDLALLVVTVLPAANRWLHVVPPMPDLEPSGEPHR